MLHKYPFLALLLAISLVAGCDNNQRVQQAELEAANARAKAAEAEAARLKAEAEMAAALRGNTATNSGRQPYNSNTMESGTAALKIERKDQLLNAAHRHTIWLNNEKIGMIANGAKYTFEFTPKSGKNVLYLEAYDPIVENPKSNKLSLDVSPGDEIVASVQWVQNGSTFDLVLDAKVNRSRK